MFIYILLDCLEKIKAERTIYNIFHLLTAKKATQTIQDSHLYGLTRYYGIARTLKREQFDQEIKSMIEQGFICMSEEQKALLTEKGRNEAKGLHDQYQSVLFLDGAGFHQSGQQFSQHLLLFIQTLTHLHQGNTRFVPIVEDVEAQRFVKKLWQEVQPQSTAAWLEQLYQELHRMLASYPESMAGVLVDHLTSAKRVGLSTYQIATKYQLAPLDVSLIYTNMMHAMCQTVIDTEDFPVLSRLYPHHPATLMISASAKKTNQLLHQQLTIDQMADIRHLKANTIMDHIVEIAYHSKQVAWQTFMTDDEYQQISQVLHGLRSRKLKTIKENLPEQISFFQIKLVMALER
ncbi:MULTISPECIES: helix-turn-helix domain-containing protein [Gracilibacillus]|uniref:helix-turn-helix domain-containing protein n=1 Tax=Gracilibacillus TaxID=74385 RepID=UPI0008270FD0|nr:MULTISPECIES: helix-turn-helix domain-containing protein [Gracilibacillus]